MQISKKKLSLVFDCILIILSAGYFRASFNIKDSASLNLSPSFYPRLLAIGLFLLGITALAIDVWGSGKTETGKTNLGNIRIQLTILACMLIFVYCWQYLKIFYPAIFVLVFILTVVYDHRTDWKRKALMALLTAVLFTLFIWLVFGCAMHMKFV